jgi:Domain of unknown function (DUF1814).
MLNIAAHKDVLLQVLRDIYSDETVGPFLGFKGGTAAYLFYGLDRFSVDLDFDLLDVGEKEYVFGRIKEIIQKYGVVKDSRIKRFNLFFFAFIPRQAKKARKMLKLKSIIAVLIPATK